MSTKTITKRVALATVVALGAGVLSLVTVSSASAAAGPNLAAGTVQTALNTEGTLNIATLASVTGSAVNTPTLSTGVSTLASSVGLVNVSDLSGTLVAGTTQTATLLSSGAITVYSNATTAHESSTILVTGGTISSGAVVGGGSVTSAINAGSTAYSVIGDGTAADGAFAITAKPSSGATSMTIQLFTNLTVSPYSAATATGTPTSGTLGGQIVVTIAAASTAGVASAAKSGVWYIASGATGTTVDDATLPSSTDTATTQYGQVRVRDSYGSGVTLASGLLQVSATNGGLVKFTSSTTKGTVSTDYSTTAVDGNNSTDFSVAAPSSAPLTTVVTASFNGTVIGTKTYTFTGEVSKITLSSAVNGRTANQSGNYFVYSMYDSAGNALYNKYGTAADFTGGSASTFTPVGNLFATASTLNSVVTGIANYRGASISTTGTVQSGKEMFTCSATAGTASVSVTYTNNSGTVIVSNALPVTCSGAPVTYTAALDKSKYVPGDIATLTITFKDIKGNLADDVTFLSNSTNLISWTGSQMTTAVTGWTPALAAGPYDQASNGVFQMKFIVGTTNGTYTGITDVPLLDSTVTGQSAVTTAYSVSDGGTSLNDVLKGIVSLIASINKQIAALAKLVAPKAVAKKK